MLCDIAKDVRKDWKTINPVANEYLKGLESMQTIKDMYGLEYGDMVVAQFLDKAIGWRGEVARQIKAELKVHLDDFVREEFRKEVI
jgi:hypothetical protein